MRDKLAQTPLTRPLFAEVIVLIARVRNHIVRKSKVYPGHIRAPHHNTRDVLIADATTFPQIDGGPRYDIAHIPTTPPETWSSAWTFIGVGGHTKESIGIRT